MEYRTRLSLSLPSPPWHFVLLKQVPSAEESWLVRSEMRSRTLMDSEETAAPPYFIGAIALGNVVQASFGLIDFPA